MTGPLQALAARYDRLATQRRGRGLRLFDGEDLLRAGAVGVGRLLDVQRLQDIDRQEAAAAGHDWCRRRSSAPRDVASNFLLGQDLLRSGRAAGEEGARICCRSTQPSRTCMRSCWPEPTMPACRRCSPFCAAGRPSALLRPPFSADMLDTNLVFRLDGDVSAARPTRRRASIWTSQLGSADAPRPCALSPG